MLWIKNQEHQGIKNFENEKIKIKGKMTKNISAKTKKRHFTENISVKYNKKRKKSEI